MKHIIPILVILLFIVSAVSPMVIGFTVRTTKTEVIDEEYAYNRFNEHHYPEGYLTGQYPLEGYADDVSSEEVIEDEERTVTEKKYQKPQQTVISSGPMDSPWPMYCHDNVHTGRSPYSTLNNPLQLKWQFKLKGGSYHCSPVIDSDGFIYVAREDLYAIYPNGTMKWEYDFPFHAESTPAIDENGIIYVGTVWAMPNYMYAVFSNNGTRKWRYKTGNHITSSPAIGDDGTIYFGDWNGYIHAVYPNGTMKWKYKTGDVITGSPAISPDGTIYCGSHDDRVYALYPNNGTVKWSFNTGSWVHGSPSIGSDGTVYVGSDNGKLYALYPNNGTEIWRCSVGATQCSPAIDENGTLYVGVFEEKFHAVYPNGTKKWTFNAGGRMWLGSSSAISVDETIYFGTTPAMGGHGGDFIALNPDGTGKWRYSPGWYESSPAIGSDGTVYVVSSSGNGFLCAFGRAEVKADADCSHYGLINEPMQFNGSATGGYPPYTWSWDFDDDGVEDSTDQNPSYNYTSPGDYTVTLTVTDDSENTSDDTTWAWIQETNDPPDKPSIDGPTSGKVGTFYDYTAQTTDPDGNDILYYFYWGDGYGTGWLGPFDSGEDVMKHHRWTEKGTYNITCKAKDVYGEESDFGTLKVTMPKNQNMWFLRWVGSFPLLNQIVNLLMEKWI